MGALDPDVKLTLFDPKLVELAAWQGSAARLVGPNVEEAIDVLKGLISELDDRYLTLLANRARKVTEGDGLPLHLVGIEELAYFTNGPDRKAAQAFSTLLRDFVARGRAGGMVTVATTQKPSADVVPTFLRDLFGFRWALRCSTPEASDTILGRGWASQGYSATSIDPTVRGVLLSITMRARAGAIRRRRPRRLLSPAAAPSGRRTDPAGELALNRAISRCGCGWRAAWVQAERRI